MWREEALPERWRLFRETWLRHHPDWEHRLWTDESLLAFTARCYPEMVPILESYPSPVMRADATRYLLLDHFGGVYADLDTECLRPIEPLLSDADLLLPLEPEEHVSSAVAREFGLSRIVGNAWMASVPGHGFWKRVIEALVERRGEKGPLAATGPFLLTDLVGSGLPEDQVPRLLPSSTVFPATNLDLGWLNARKPGSPHGFGPGTHAIHYWDGTWWRTPGQRTKVHLLRSTRPVVSGWLDGREARALLDAASPPPLVSCLMVTGRRPALAALAIDCFRRQTHPARELIVIDDSGTDALADAVGNDPDGTGGLIRWVKLPPGNQPLGALRNRALAEARGDFLCQWDDDDLSAPDRLERQLGALLATGADACAPARLHLWWPARDWIAESSSRIWECALMWRRGAIAGYPERRAGEDTPPVQALARSGLIAVLEAPELYTYVHHGANTFPEAHWMTLWSASRRRATGEACRLRLGLMEGILPCGAYLQATGGEPLDRSSALPREEAPGKEEPAALPRRRSARPERTDPPPVLVATPIKDAGPHLERFFKNWEETDYPAARLSLVMLESDSADDSAARAQRLLAEHAGRFARTGFWKSDHGFRPEEPRWSPSVQRRRRAVLARCRNELLERGLQQESWVLWTDVDVESWPPDVIHRLLEAGRSIVAPHCVLEPGGASYDLNTFVFRDPSWGDGEDHRLDGLYQPPRGETRRYLESFRREAEIVVDGIGGTMLLIDADLHRDGLRFPARPYRGYLESEGLAFLARDLGSPCWALPGLEIVHR